MWFRFVGVGALVAGLISLYGIVHQQGSTIGCLRGVVGQQQDEIAARDNQATAQQAQIDGLAGQLQAHGIQPLYVVGGQANQPQSTGPHPAPTTTTTSGRPRRATTTTTTRHPPTTTTTTSLVPVITLPTLPVVAASVSQQSC